MNRIERALEGVERVFAPVAAMKAEAEEADWPPHDSAQRGDADIKVLGALAAGTGVAIATGTAILGAITEKIPNDWQTLGIGTGLGATAIGSIIYLTGRK